MLILAAGLDAVAPFEGGPEAISVGPVDEPAQLPDLLQQWGEHVDDDARALALLPTWGPVRQREAYEALRMLVGQRRLLLVETDLPPVAATLLGGVLAGAARHVEDLAIVALLAPGLARRIAAFAWTSSVARLAHVEVPMSFHLRSYATRKGFVVRYQPERSVTPVDADGQVASTLPPSPHALVADQDGDPAWRERVLDALLAPATTISLPPSPASSEWWGAKRLIEVATVSGDVAALVRESRQRLPVLACTWCGGPSVTVYCPQCHSGRPPMLGEPTTEEFVT